MLWPKSLIPEIASRRCIIFVGAGASAGCQNSKGERPPNWEKFLIETNAKFVMNPEDNKLASNLIGSKQFLDAAEIIFSHVDPPDAGQHYRETFHTPDYKPYRLHEIINELDSKIVITTNYDQIYEKQCEPQNIDQGYITKVYTDYGILDEIRSPTRLIIKAHGCVTSPQQIILTRSQYFEAKNTYSRFYNLLDSLFLTNTILFIGCGLGDPDIQLVLENTNIAVPSVHPHYALVPTERHPAIIKSIKKSYNIKLIEYDNSCGTHSEQITVLEELLHDVQAYRTTYGS
jgi:hypothetical protein